MATVKMKKETYNLELTLDEAYTLQILLGFVAGDSESYSISKKLAYLTEEEMDTYDYDRVVFAVEGCCCYSNKIETSKDESVAIRFV